MKVSDIKIRVLFFVKRSKKCACCTTLGQIISWQKIVKWHLFKNTSCCALTPAWCHKFPLWAILKATECALTSPITMQNTATIRNTSWVLSCMTHLGKTRLKSLLKFWVNMKGSKKKKALSTRHKRNTVCRYQTHTNLKFCRQHHLLKRKETMMM